MTFVRGGASVLIVGVFLGALASGSGRAAAVDQGTLVIGDGLRSLALPLGADVLDAIREERWDAALTGLAAVAPQGPDQQAGHAFLTAWALAHAGRPAEAAPLVPKFVGSPAVPEVYAAYVRGEALLATGKAAEALAAFDAVSTGYRPAIASKGAARAADALLVADAAQGGEQARARLQAAAPFVKLAALGSDDDALLLLRLAELTGPGPEAYALLRRIWTEAPGTDADRAAAAALGKYPQAATWQERTLRAERWMDRQDWGAALAETDAIVGEAAGTTLDACRLRFVRGRSLYKKNRITDAVTALTGIGEACASVDVDYGPRGLYLLATAQYRRKAYQASADAYRAIVKLYSKHSMADDALTRGGIALLEAGQADVARAWWEEALRDYPNGDTVPEALLRLAMHSYLSGDGADARTVALKLGQLPVKNDPVSVAAGRYWAARWRLYPTAAAPSTPSSDPTARSEAVAEWKALCEQIPHSFYAILAYSRLVEVAPDVAAAVAKRPPTHDDGARTSGWAVRADLMKDPHVRDGVALARLGLVTEAQAEWALRSVAELAPDERAWLSELRMVAGDWLAAHDELRRWMSSHPLGTLGSNEPAIARIVYPDRYWPEVQASVRDTYRYEPRLFHALVREESSFDRKIVSFAGAIGLSQLMPATAKQTAGWLGKTVTDAQLREPETNLLLGARYLDAMVGQLDGSPYLALAGYNGGAANVTKWVTEDNNPPTDEFIEQIPFEETRGYVKRVMGTWQTMRYRADTERPAFPDLSAFNHRALPVRAAQ